MMTLKYESNLAVAGIIFNLGDVEGTKHIFNKCNLELSDNFTERLREYEDKGEKNKSLWMSKKGAIRRQRTKNLGKYQPSAEGRKKYNESLQYVDSQHSSQNLAWEVINKLAEERRDELKAAEKEKKRREKEEAKAKKNEEKRKKKEEEKKEKLEQKERKKRERDEEKKAKQAAKKAKL